MIACVKNVPLKGRITAPPSKSLTHRALICAQLSGGCVVNAADNLDTLATRRCLAAMAQGGVMDAGESATTLRLLIPLALLNGGGVFRVEKSLAARPLTAYEALGMELNRQGGRIEARGKLAPGEYTLDASVSSQFASGLLLALPLLSGDSRLTLLSAVSRPYIRLTTAVMRYFGVNVQETETGYIIPGGQRYRRSTYTVEGDWSYAANFIVANALGGNVEIAGLSEDSEQGDRAIAALLGRERADLSDTPDLLPLLMAAACARRGETRLIATGRLKYKESDRPHAMAEALCALGGEAHVLEDEVIVKGTGRLKGGQVACEDHRIAMALAAAAPICEAPVTIYGAECVAKSAPGFFEDIAVLGGMQAEHLR